MSYTNVEGTARASERQRLCRNITEALAPLNVITTIHHETGIECTINMEHPRLSAMILLPARFSSEAPIVSWYGAKGRLRFIQMDWGSHANTFQHHRTTSFPKTFNGMIECLVGGFHAAEQGTAFSCESNEESQG